MASGDHELDSPGLDDAELDGDYGDAPFEDFDEDFDDDFDDDFDAAPEELDELDEDFEDELDEVAIDEDLDELDDDLPEAPDAPEARPAPDPTGTGVDDTEEDDEDEDDDVELLAQATEEDELDEALEGLREDEFICRSCYLAKGPSQLADARRMICVDCV